jgi:hypothetical protein
MSGGGKVLDKVGGSGIGSAIMGPAGAVIGGVAGINKLKGLLPNNKINVPGSMARPEWSLSGQDGKLRPDLLLGNQMPQAAGQSQQMLDQLVSRATSQGPTQQAKYLQDANQRNMQNSMAQAEEAGRGQLASMTGQLAMRGGLDSGARERLGSQAGFQTLMNKQRIANDASGRDLDILAQDEAQKTGMMQALPQSLLAQAGFERGGKQFDIANTLATVGGKYEVDMNEWGANQAAREQAKLANKNRGLLGLGVMGL